MEFLPMTDGRRLPSRFAQAVITVHLGLTLACGPGPMTDELEIVQRPADLTDLDLSVQQQFEEIWAELRRVESDHASDARSVGEAWGRLGQWFDVYDHDESAVRSYTNAASLDPDDPRWPYYLGSLAEERGDFDEAESRFARAARLAPEEVAPRVWLGDLALRRQQLDKAEAIYRDVLAEAPDNAAAAFGVGRVALLRDDAETAIEYLQRVLRSQPEASQVHYALGQAWRRLGHAERAREHLEKVPADNLHQTRLGRESAWDYELASVDRGALKLTRLGVRAMRQGRRRDAVTLLGRAVAADPEGPEKRINYATALRAVGRPDAALEQLQTAVELAGVESHYAVDSYVEMGKILGSAQQWEKAETHLLRALEIDPQSAAAHAELGRILQWQGRLDEAVSHYSELRRLDPANISAAFWYGALLSVELRELEAIRALREDLGRLGEGDVTRDLRALLARILAASEGAGRQDAILEARQLVGDSPGTSADSFWVETHAMVAAAAGRFDAATAWQSAALAALEDRRPPVAAQIARRRLLLYERGEPGGLPWQARELLIKVEVAIP